MAKYHGSDAPRDGYDPVSAFEQRRQIFNSVQEVQRLEHRAMKRIADATVSHKRELLQALSTWLLNQTMADTSHDDVTWLSGCDMDEWLTLQAQGKLSEDELTRRERELQIAESAYSAEASWEFAKLGVINDWLAEGAQKEKQLRLKAAAQQKTASRDSEAGRLRTNVQRRQQFGKKFLRGCLANMQQLEKTLVFGDQVRQTSSEIARCIEEEWLAHLRANHAALIHIGKCVQDLERIYHFDRGL